MSDVRLMVGGRLFGSWERVQISRSIESVSGSFSLDVTDRLAVDEEEWRIVEEDECRVEIDGEPVIVGYVDRRRIAISAQSRDMHYSGRDKVGTLVDCSAIPGQWSYRDATLEKIARELSAPFGIPVSVQQGLTLPRHRKISISPGETAWTVIDRVARSDGVLAVSDGAGGLLLTRAGAGRAAPLVEGVNIISATVEYDGADRFSSYVVPSTPPGTDNASGDALRVRATATDEGVRRTDRVLLVHPESGLNAKEARRLADWTARSRAARAEAVSVTVHGWKQPDGELWPVNGIAPVRSPSLGVRGDMLIATATYSRGPSGELTRMRLVRPDAFAPDSQARVGEGVFKVT